MSLAYDEPPLEEEPKDRTKWVWLGILVLAAILTAVLWTTGRRSDWPESMVRARHILIQFDKNDPASRRDALELIKDLRQQIENGESFAALAREYSNDAYSSSRGGDLGYYRKGSFDDAFEEYVWNAPTGELSDVIETTHGFHLIEVVDRHWSKADAYERDLKRKVIDKGEPATAPEEAPSPAAGE